MRRVYIVLSTIGVGGAEKRFTDVWCALLRQGLDVHLVMDTRTHAALTRQKAYEALLERHPNIHLLDLKGASYLAFTKAVWRFFRTQPRDAVVHFPIAFAPGVQTLFGHRLVVSWVSSSRPKFRLGRLKHVATAWASFLAADHIDVLNPGNLHHIASIPALRDKVSLTAGGTHVDGDLYRPGEKELELVLLGRMEPIKQCLRFVEQLPEVHRLLQEWGFRNYRFLVCGDGSESAAIAAAAQREEFRHVPFSFGFTDEPEAVLGRASVFFSLQRVSNYPSKALAEAMAAGAFPVVTDVGESGLMLAGCPNFALVPESFSAADLANAVRSFLVLTAPERNAAATRISEYARNRFTIEEQAAYFAALYRRIGAP